MDFIKKTLIWIFVGSLIYIGLCVFKFYDSKSKFLGYSYPIVADAKACQFLKPAQYDESKLSLPDEASCKSVILISNGINVFLYDAFKKYLLNNPEHPSMVCFNSSGGSLEYKITCNSSCVFLLMSGVNRLKMGSVINLGIHHPGRILPLFGFNQPLIFNEPFFDHENNPWVSIIHASASEDKDKFFELYSDALKTDHDDIHMVSHKYLFDNNVFNTAYEATGS